MSRPHSLAEPLRIAYEQATVATLCTQPDVLAIIGFGQSMKDSNDARVLRVGLEPFGTCALEVWRSSTPVTFGRHGELRWSSNGEQTFFAIEVDETAHADIAGATEHAYRSIDVFITASTTPHLLRLWNYLDAINLGEGDAERYRSFCAGRARGMRNAARAGYPAASAIGRKDGQRIVQVYGLAARTPGTPIENPRQLSAWRYPRQYGPIAPTFARGMLTSSQLLISGTAAVVGHASRHEDDLVAQIEETLANLDSLLGEAGATARTLGAASCLKIYLRHAGDAALVLRTVGAHAPALRNLMVLAGDICRRELLVEIDGVHRLDV